jgi:DNA-binding NtrC family response regulator
MSAQRQRAVLCVEDDALLRLDTADQLRRKGFRVIEAADAQEALAVLTSASFVVDIVFTDIQMPGSIDGIGLARWVRSHRPNLTIAIASGSGSAIDAARSVCADALVFLKPYSADEVAAAFQSAFEDAIRPAGNGG